MILNANNDVGNSQDITKNRFLQYILKEDLKFIRGYNWPTSQDFPEVLPFDNFVIQDGSGDLVTAFLKHEDICGYIHLTGGHLYIELAGPTPKSLEVTEKTLRAIFPRAEPVEGNTVSINFWAHSKNGPRQISRKLIVPKWCEVELNYTQPVREILSDIMSWRTNPKGTGQLILWRGLAGTGKTWAIRALASEWRHWCSFSYITDPDALFGSGSYLLSVLLDEDEDNDLEQWRLLILEDTGELLSADARSHTGQGLSRLLNTVDGLIGQGLRILVLITTNEEIGTIHPAIARPGRCLVNAQFTQLTPAEIATWAIAHNLKTHDHDRAYNVAELYNLISHGQKRAVTQTSVGFAR